MPSRANVWIDGEHHFPHDRDRLRSMPIGDFDVEYDPNNNLFDVLKRFLVAFAPENYCSVQFTSNSNYQTDQTDYSFCKQYSSAGGKGGRFLPGNVLDVLLKKDGRAYFASIFFSTSERTVKYRLVRLVKTPADPLRKAFNEMGKLQSGDDKTLDEGRNPFDDNLAITVDRIRGWLRHQIEQDNPAAI
jgi:hypothetical protein